MYHKNHVKNWCDKTISNDIVVIVLKDSLKKSNNKIKTFNLKIGVESELEKILNCGLIGFDWTNDWIK